MLIISNNQMGDLNRLFNDRYEALTASHLAAKYPDWSEQQGPEKVRVFVTDGVKKAERYHITSSSDVTAFLEYTVQLGPGFEQHEEHEWAANILNIRNLSGAEKVGRMLAARPL